MVELSQIPKQHQDMANKRFTLFNTNNVWISLKALHQKLVEDRLTVDVVTTERVLDRVKILQVRWRTCWMKEGSCVRACHVCMTGRQAAC